MDDEPKKATFEVGKVRGRRLTVCKKVLPTVATALVSLMAERDTFVSLSLVVELTPCDLVSYCLAIKKATSKVAFFMAGAVRFELTTLGFGDRCSTN